MEKSDWKFEYTQYQKKKKKQRKKNERIKEIKERRPVAGRRGSFLEPLNDGRRGSKLPIRAR